MLILAVIAAAGAFIGAKRYLPETRPGVINRRQGIPFWEAAASAGKKTMIVHVPVTSPANDFDDGYLLSGLGVPDMSGRVGKPFFFTSELDFHRSGANEFSIEVVQLIDNKGVIPTEIQGPPNKLFKDPPYIKILMTINVAQDRQSITIEESGQKLTMKPGEWSNWTDFVFPFNPLIKLRGVSRFHLIPASRRRSSSISRRSTSIRAICRRVSASRRLPKSAPGAREQVRLVQDARLAD